MTSERWIADLDTLAVQLPARHVAPFRVVPRERFQSAVASLRRAIPSLTPHQTVLGFTRLVAMIGDGHTSFFPSDQSAVPFDRSYPLRLFDFDDGLYVVAAPHAYADLVGRRVVRIGVMSVDSAKAAVAPYIARDNDMELRYTAPELLVNAELLHAIGIAPSADQASFTFDGPQSPSVMLEAIPDTVIDRMKWKPANPALGDTAKSVSWTALFAQPWTIDHRRESYWFAERPQDRLLYFQYNTCWDQKDRPTFAEVVESMFAVLDQHADWRLVIDLRQNPGGEPRLAKPLLDGIFQRQNRGLFGPVLVLVGRRTFSAALTNAADLKRFPGAMVIGESPRGRPNNPSEGRSFTLPNCGGEVSVSTEWVRRYPELGSTPYLPVDIPVRMTFADWRRGVDAAYGVAVAFQPAILRHR
jgi:hypothetical protein